MSQSGRQCAIIPSSLGASENDARTYGVNGSAKLGEAGLMENPIATAILGVIDVLIKQLEPLRHFSLD